MKVLDELSYETLIKNYFFLLNNIYIIKKFYLIIVENSLN